MSDQQQSGVYETFLTQKAQYGARTGFKPLWMPSFLFDFQASIAEYNIEMGRSLTAADCGMGKTPIEHVWAENVVRHTNKPVLELTPLAVAKQAVEEAGKFGIDARRSNDGKVQGARIHVTNYEKLHHFNPDDFGGVVCDESSAIKAFDGKRRAEVTEFLRTIPYRLLATATAAPNDYIELGTSSEALGVMGQVDMLNRFFKNDNNTSDQRAHFRGFAAPRELRQQQWRFKGHAEIPFWRWCCGWMRAGRKPSDFGPFRNERFQLTRLIEREHIVETRTLADGMLFALPAANMPEEREEKRRTIPERCEMAAELTAHTKQPFVIWCQLNDEGDLLERIVPDCKQVYGAMSDEEKEDIYDGFQRGQIRGVATKHKIGAWGLNWQHCAHVVEFAGHSFEQHYQGVRRCWRFGQTRDVVNDIIATEGQRGARENMRRKSDNADRMFSRLIEHMHEAIRIDGGIKYEKRMELPSW